MNFQDKLKSILNNKSSLQVIIVLLGISLAVGIFRYIELNREKDKYLTENNLVILKYKMSQQKIDTLTNEKNQLITKQQVVTSEDQTSINKLSDEVFNLKKKDAKNTETLALLRTDQKASVDSLNVPFTGSIEVDSTKRETTLINKDSAELRQYIREKTIEVPQSVEYKDTTIAFNGTVTKEGITIDSLSIPNTLNQRIVKKDGGWFKSDTYEFQSSNTSKYFHTTGEQSLLFTPKQKGTFWKVIGGIALGAAGVLIIK